MAHWKDVRWGTLFVDSEFAVEGERGEEHHANGYPKEWYPMPGVRTGLEPKAESDTGTTMDLYKQMRVMFEMEEVSCGAPEAGGGGRAPETVILRGGACGSQRAISLTDGLRDGFRTRSCGYL